jgi:hypothetical protein
MSNKDALNKTEYTRKTPPNDIKRRRVISVIPSIAMFISGYTPLFLILMINDITNITWYSYTFSSSVVGFSQVVLPVGLVFNNPIVVLSLFILSIFSLVMLRYVIKNITVNAFVITITEVKSRSSELANYTIPYLISFVAVDLAKWQDLFSFAVFLSLLCLLSIRSQSTFINPILAAFGYGLYDCHYTENNNPKTCVMISAKDLSSNETVHYKKLNNYLGIIKK